MKQFMVTAFEKIARKIVLKIVLEVYIMSKN